MSFILTKLTKLKRINNYWAFKFSNVREKIRRERAERLMMESVYYPTKTSDNLQTVRNIGIIAHIDAGKTTVTERMLYYAGALDEPGEVHDGNTVMDYLSQERERGITIRAAATTFTWDKHQFNLIDTPGHIDFTGEVERSLRVLDGAIAIFDGVSGVQTQSESVWFQANKFNVPRLAFINKMDRSGASLEYTLETIKKRLNVIPITIQLPILESDNFQGVIDLIGMRKISWKDQMGNVVDINPLQSGTVFEKAKKWRESLIESIGAFDDKIADMYLNGIEVTGEEVHKAIKKIIQEKPNKSCVVLCGSALKNRGIQPLMDAIIKYLPSPSEKPKIVGIDPSNNTSHERLPNKKQKLCAYAFKIINGSEKGCLAYVRVYSGVLQNRLMLLNTNKNLIEKALNIYRVRANKYVSVNEISAGDIAAISGFRITGSGDTLIDSKDEEKIQLESVKMPPPVFIAALEYEYMKDKPALNMAIKNFIREDSSISVKEDEETGQILVSGLGELHLEVFRDRLESEYGLKTKLGKMKVSYRESIERVVEEELVFQKVVNGKEVYATIKLRIEPIDKEELQKELGHFAYLIGAGNLLKLAFNKSDIFIAHYEEFKSRLVKKEKKKKLSDWDEPDNQLEDSKKEDDQKKNTKKEEEKEEESHSSLLKKFKFIKNPTRLVELKGEVLKDEKGEDQLYSIESIPFEHLISIEQTIENSLARGSLLSYPMTNTKVTILSGKYSLTRSPVVAFNMCTSQLIGNLIKKGIPKLLEPVMEMEISTPSTQLKDITNDLLNNRRGRILEVKDDHNRFGGEESRNIILSRVPLQETIGYSTFLRSISKGEASFVMAFKDYDYVGKGKEDELMKGDF